MKLSLREAFALEPVLDVKVGERTYGVPPLTFGRLDELVKAQKDTDLAALKSEDFASRIKDGSAEAIGRALAYFPTEAFAPSAVAVIPGMTRDVWQKSGTPFIFLDLVRFFAATHDWGFISEMMFGRAGEKTEASNIDLQTAILMIAKELGCRIDEPLGFRAEGFFMAVDAIKSRRIAQEDAQEKAEREAEGWDGYRPVEQVIGVHKDPAAVAKLDKLAAEAVEPKAQAPNG